MNEAQDFGTHEGETVHRATITGGRLTASIMTYGAVLQDLRLEGHEPSLVCGFPDFAPYPDQSPHFGATPGRVANRIGNAAFTLDGTTHNLAANKGMHMLHGGENGYGTRLWQIADLGTSHIDLTLHDTDGHAGFPGNVEATCSYTLKDDGVLHIALTTVTDAPTVTNLTHHSYFDLGGSGDIRDHILQVHAETRLPVDEDFIPTGAPVSVAGAGRDFREPRAVDDALEQLARDDDGVLDHNFCLAAAPRGIQHVATLDCPASGMTMEMATTEPGVQVYAGHKVSTHANGNNGTRYGAYAGLCLEPQLWPDAPNQDSYPSAVLRPGETRRQVTTYRFVKS
ncbi:MAG: aldose epimerase family protein [Pseudomonadota bacterium]